MENYFIGSRFCASEKIKVLWLFISVFAVLWLLIRVFALFNVNKVHGTWSGRPMLAQSARGSTTWLGFVLLLF
jgi:uncharacterized integral membrane protein